MPYVSGAGGAGGAISLGSTQLIYRFTITGSDATTIDTGVNTPDKGSNDWTNGDLLEILITARTDGAGQISAVLGLTFNNDSGANYDLEVASAQNVTAAATVSNAGSSFGALIFVHGSGGASTYPGAVRIVVPDFAGTTFFKTGLIEAGANDPTASQNIWRGGVFGWRSTSAITRFAVSATGGEKLKVGSQLLVYKRVAS